MSGQAMSEVHRLPVKHPLLFLLLLTDIFLNLSSYIAEQDFLSVI